MTEVRVARASGDDQGVVGDRRAPVRADRLQIDPAPGEVEAGDLTHEDADIATSLEDRSQRIADLPGGEGSGRDLVGQRLEEVEVAPIDERHVDRGAADPHRRLEAAEAAADHDDAMASAVG